MIIHMARVRIAGPAALLDRTLALLQDLEVVHVATPAVRGGLGVDGAGPLRDRTGRSLRRILEDVETTLVALGSRRGAPSPRAPESLPRAALEARRTRRKADAIARRLGALEDERVLLLRYRDFFRAFGPLLARGLDWPDGRAFYVVLREGAGHGIEPLRANLEAATGGEIEVLSHALPSGETAVLLIAARGAADKVEQLLSASSVHELPAPPGIADPHGLTALDAIQRRLAELPAALADLEGQRKALGDARGAAFEEIRAWLHDRLLVLDARARAHAGSHLFVIDGWAPSSEVRRIAARIQSALGPEIVFEALATEPWARGDAPVSLRNPPLFRPFEIITRAVPLPRYGTIDPTPFVAVFFPMFFGLMLGDAGYGAILAALAFLLGARAKPGTRARSIAYVAGACAVFSIAFGLAFGEIFGDLPVRVLRVRPWGFDRGEAVLPFLALTAAIGVVHVTLGIVLAMIGAWHQGKHREALGRGLAAAMIALAALALLASLHLLPPRFFTPLVVAVLVAFPVLIFLEGITAVVELASNFGQILSYARIMALGTASLMLAVVANRMVGAMGSVVVGVLFALLFHVVNFAIGLFSPTIHALRLHYVEFFGRFFSPGGTAYRPLMHWHPTSQGS